jgi:hypothetical protein
VCLDVEAFGFRGNVDMTVWAGFIRRVGHSSLGDTCERGRSSLDESVGPVKSAELALRCSELNDEIESLRSSLARMLRIWVAGTTLLLVWSFFGGSLGLQIGAVIFVIAMAAFGLVLRGSMRRYIREREAKLDALETGAQ